jgi:hypothetical protein
MRLPILSMMAVVAFSSPTLALSRYECKGLTNDIIVLTPFDDGSVTLSFDNGPVKEKSVFANKANVLSAEFRNLDGVAGTSLIYIVDTLTNNGFEIGRMPPKPLFAAKIACRWLEK